MLSLTGSPRILGVGALLLLVGCTTKQEISKLDAKPQFICIVQHQAVRPGVLEVLQEGLRNHGIQTKVVAGVYELKEARYYPSGWSREQVASCDTLLFYVANWSWDLALYMRFASIWMTTTDGRKILASARYDASGNIGPGKFIVAREKLLELVDEMVPTPPPLRVPASAKGDARSRLEQLEELRKKGLVSEQEYIQKRQEILNQL